MNAIRQTVITNKTGVCLAVIAEIADYADKAARKTQFQELKKKTANLSTFPILLNV